MGKSDSQEDKALFEWRVHLARQEPRKTAAVVGVALVATIIIQICSRNPLLAGICGLLLLAAAGEFLFPIHYRMTEDGVSMRNFLSYRYIAWKDIRRCYRGPAGIKLSPLERRNWRETFRGIHIWIEGEEQDKAVETIRALRPSQGIINKAVLDSKMDAKDYSNE